MTVRSSTVFRPKCQAYSVPSVIGDFSEVFPFVLVTCDDHQMKSMTCRQLGGACDYVFSGDTFDDLAALSQQHSREMFQAKDAPHMDAVGRMTEIMASGELDAWMAAREAEFNAL